MVLRKPEVLEPCFKRVGSIPEIDTLAPTTHAEFSEHAIPRINCK
jgi:hypothetical protein